MKHQEVHKQLYLLFLAILISLGLAGQEQPKQLRFYLGLNGGYGFPATPATVAFPYDGEQFTPSNASWKHTPFSLGKGILTGVECGFWLRKNIAIELGLNQVLGSSCKFSYSHTDSTGSVEAWNYIYKAKMFRIIPAIRIVFGEGNLLPYSRLGFIVGIPSGGFCIIQDYAQPGGYLQDTITYRGGLSLGLRAGCGLTYDTHTRFSAFAELTGYLQNWNPVSVSNPGFAGILPFSTLGFTLGLYLKL